MSIYFLEVKILSFGERLRTLREGKNLTQKELGKILGLEQRTISNYEIDIRFKNGDRLIKIADFFGVSIDYLLRDDYNNEDKNKEK
jgi:transcriptional regulator with XRE-family HTH domain